MDTGSWTQFRPLQTNRKENCVAFINQTKGTSSSLCYLILLVGRLSSLSYLIDNSWSVYRDLKVERFKLK